MAYEPLTVITETQLKDGVCLYRCHVIRQSLSACANAAFKRAKKRYGENVYMTTVSSLNQFLKSAGFYAARVNGGIR